MTCHFYIKICFKSCTLLDSIGEEGGESYIFCTPTSVKCMYVCDIRNVSHTQPLMVCVYVCAYIRVYMHIHTPVCALMCMYICIFTHILYLSHTESFFSRARENVVHLCSC